jgi:UDP-glucose 4-epimerase
MRAVVTGAAGFIGSHLVDRLLAAGDHVVGLDNFSTGQRNFLSQALTQPRFELVQGDLLDLTCVRSAIQGADIVFHLAANADVRFGTHHPRRDLEQNTIATWNVLESMRQANVRRIIFSSTGSIYGEPKVIPTTEDCPFPIQTSLYGASKLAAEGLIQAYAEGFGFSAYVFRFVSILGERYSHGHIFDFLKQLLADPSHLHVLGNGKQRKSYLYVHDCIDAILTAIQSPAKLSIYNLGTSEYCSVNDSIGWICARLGVKPELTFSGGERGWIGDSPIIFLDCNRIRALGWEPSCSIQQAVVRTVDYLLHNQWLLQDRDGAPSLRPLA